MAANTITIYTCDCCGRESQHKDFRTGNESGGATLSIKGDRGARAYDGAWGGMSYKVDDLLCFSCADKLREMYLEMKLKKQDG